jgi:hypothetical protein
VCQNNLLGDDIPIVVVLKACGMQVHPYTTHTHT